MSLHLFIKKKKYALRLSTIFLKKALFFFKRKQMNLYFSKKSTIHTFFSRPIFFLKKHTSLFHSLDFQFLNFVKEKYFATNSIFGMHFFSLDQTYKLNFTITFTKRNFFISIGSNIKWRFFVKPDKIHLDEHILYETSDPDPSNSAGITEVEFFEKKVPLLLGDVVETLSDSIDLDSESCLNRMYINATVSAGSTNLEDKSKRLRFSNYAVGKDLAVLIVSIFWTSIHKLELPLFSISVKFKGRIKWSRAILASVWRSINKLYWEHQSYVLRHRSVDLKTEESELLSAKYEHSLSRLKMIEECPLFFELLTSVKSIPHNGCKIKKASRLRRNR